MLKRVTISQWLRSKVCLWLDACVYVCSDFRACGVDAHVDPGVHITEPKLVTLGKGSAIYRGCTILTGPGAFVLGDYSHLAGSVYVNALQAAIHIGNGVAIGPFCVLLSYSNAVLPGKTISEARISSDVRIGDDVFLGAGAIVLPGVTIGAGAVIGAGSVVTHDVPSKAIVAGVPTRLLRQRV